ncbi:hypothetical protein [[Flexibacter] sp. ATCC 35103]|uniref:hypothetical protein n=1 Tax=[Flexibacter] sp. ATCC 35103 TaxID=1937528 RepID=UPI0009D4ACBA|nr:hypothetical protein [[Flexibacter] sp. ATCC 35103]OMQ13561.1 hypothetical protein BXU01_03535 [[Flexibacter] sp. ATCC 35103]
MSNFPDLLTDEKIKDSNKDFRNALFSLDKKFIDKDNYVHLTRIYSATKQLDIRNKILRLLYDFDFPYLKDFFDTAYKKERYLDMKIYALRGLSQFVSEKEIEKLLIKFNLTLLKRQETTPYNYQEYELLRGKNSLPYLVQKYNYNCFKETLNQVNEQYNAMPYAFKGHFTIDENGEGVSLRSPEESSKMIKDFFNKQ